MRLVSLFCLSLVAFSIPAADQPSIALSQKRLALKRFLESPVVGTAIRKWTDDRYQLLSTDCVPYRFASSDEGPHTDFLVVAWLGRQDKGRWNSTFVAAKVDTDPFTSRAVIVIDSTKLALSVASLIP